MVKIIDTENDEVWEEEDDEGSFYDDLDEDNIDLEDAYSDFGDYCQDHPEDPDCFDYWDDED